MTSKTKPAFILRPFYDVGTNQIFDAGTVQQIDEGSFLNYRAAGLAREPTASEIAPTPATKPVAPTEPDAEPGA